MTNDTSVITSPWRRLDEINYWTQAQKRPLLLQNLLVASKIPHNSSSSPCCSLFVPTTVLKHLNTKTPSRLQSPHDLLPRLRFRFLGFFKGELLPNLDMIVKHELRTSKTPSASCVLIFTLASIGYIGSGSKLHTLRAEWRESKRRKSVDDSTLMWNIMEIRKINMPSFEPRKL